ncbi:hypothetical protein BRY73_13515 [Ochrobactrum sp. P6BS-III]|nr:hypothetical protein BRY73_13515 [Ochrobactrum sp. P6BS-III]
MPIRNLDRRSSFQRCKCLIQKSPCRAANGNFCASGAHVPKSTLRSGSRNHHFRYGLPLFDSYTKN